MPIRDYKCIKPGCGEVFEFFYRTQSEYEEKWRGVHCIKCGYIADPLPSQTARPIFKGSGFHETDYKGRQ